jgi:hypothetical protein
VWWAVRGIYSHSAEHPCRVRGRALNANLGSFSDLAQIVASERMLPLSTGGNCHQSPTYTSKNYPSSLKREVGYNIIIPFLPNTRKKKTPTHERKVYTQRTSASPARMLQPRAPACTAPATCLDPTNTPMQTRNFLNQGCTELGGEASRWARCGTLSCCRVGVLGGKHTDD